MNNSLTYLWGDHSFKGGFDIQHVADTRTSTPFQLYTFATHGRLPGGARAAQRPSATAPSSSTSASPTSTSRRTSTASSCRTTGALSDSLKVLYGLRYDLYDVPAPNASAPFETSRDFVVDKNNLAPRLGVVWTRGRRSAARWCAPTPA